MNAQKRFLPEQQLTFDPRGHQLTNINVWTPDSQWLAYDVRPNGDFNGLTIERVNCITGEIEVIYRARQGAHVGVVTVSPDMPARYVFIHGPEYPDSYWHYDFHHRRGVIVSEPDRELAVTLDAMDITAPYTPVRYGEAVMCMFSALMAAASVLRITTMCCMSGILRWIAAMLVLPCRYVV